MVGLVTGPPAQGVRIGWEQVPEPVRAAIERVLGGRVIEARTQPGGFSPGLAARARCENGGRFFIKAVSAQANPDSPGIHRQEARVLAALEPVVTARRLPVPRLFGVVEHAPWTALILEDIAGRQPAVPWLAAELALVVAAVDDLAEALTPSPIEAPTVAEVFGDDFTGWRTLAGSADHGGLDAWSRAHLDRLAAIEATWPEHAAGDTLLHCDIRADNLLIAGHRPVVVDWPWACRGAAFVDVALFAPSVAMQGGPQPAELVALSRSGRAAGRADLTALVCGLAGFFTERSLRPPPPGLPTVRRFQAAQGTVARRWLADLI